MAKSKNTENSSEFIIFKTEDEKISVDVKFEDETVWLTQDQMAMLFDKAKSTISEHIKHIFEEGELDEESVVRKFRTTASDGKGYETKQINWLWIVFYRQNKNYFTLSMEHKLI